MRKALQVYRGCAQAVQGEATHAAFFNLWTRCAYGRYRSKELLASDYLTTSAHNAAHGLDIPLPQREPNQRIVKFCAPEAGADVHGPPASKRTSREHHLHWLADTKPPKLKHRQRCSRAGCKILANVRRAGSQAL
eukprot:1004634-Pleurochrysis_carterae.AAC.1